MFHFPWFPLPALCVQAGMAGHDPYQVVLFGNPRIGACLAAPRGLSQPATSFIGFQRLGIHRVPFYTCRDDARARYRVLKVHTTHLHHAYPDPTPTKASSPDGSLTDANCPPHEESSPKGRISRPSKLHSVPNPTHHHSKLVITAETVPPATCVTLEIE
jgi:hypothetical protein